MYLNGNPGRSLSSLGLFFGRDQINLTCHQPLMNRLWPMSKPTCTASSATASRSALTEDVHGPCGDQEHGDR